MSNVSVIPFPNMKRVTQISNSHCGPAALKMLLLNLGIDRVRQRDMVEATGVARRLRVHGMTVQELAMAIRKLVPEVNLWFKTEATVDELDTLVNQYHLPVGVEWQGVFYEDEDGDSGHYGVVTAINQEQNRIRIADPYRRFSGKDRIFKLSFFARRWWDTNEIKDPATGRKRYFLDERLIFVVVPNGVTFPSLLGMIRDEEIR